MATFLFLFQFIIFLELWMYALIIDLFTYISHQTLCYIYFHYQSIPNQRMGKTQKYDLSKESYFCGNFISLPHRFTSIWMVLPCILNMLICNGKYMPRKSSSMEIAQVSLKIHFLFYLDYKEPANSIAITKKGRKWIGSEKNVRRNKEGLTMVENPMHFVEGKKRWKKDKGKEERGKRGFWLYRWWL